MGRHHSRPSGRTYSLESNLLGSSARPCSRELMHDWPSGGHAKLVADLQRPSVGPTGRTAKCMSASPSSPESVRCGSWARIAWSSSLQPAATCRRWGEWGQACSRFPGGGWCAPVRCGQRERRKLVPPRGLRRWLRAARRAPRPLPSFLLASARRGAVYRHPGATTRVPSHS